jgi:hypothetical protein
MVGDVKVGSPDGNLPERVAEAAGFKTLRI